MAMRTGGNRLSKYYISSASKTALEDNRKTTIRFRAPIRYIGAHSSLDETSGSTRRGLGKKTRYISSGCDQINLIFVVLHTSALDQRHTTYQHGKQRKKKGHSSRAFLNICFGHQVNKTAVRIAKAERHGSAWCVYSGQRAQYEHQEHTAVSPPYIKKTLWWRQAGKGWYKNKHKRPT